MNKQQILRLQKLIMEAPEDLDDADSLIGDQYVDAVLDAVITMCEQDWRDSYHADDPSMAAAQESGWHSQVDDAVSNLESELHNIDERESIGELLRIIARKVAKVENTLFGLYQGA